MNPRVLRQLTRAEVDAIRAHYASVYAGQEAEAVYATADKFNTREDTVRLINALGDRAYEGIEA